MSYKTFIHPQIFHVCILEHCAIIQGNSEAKSDLQPLPMSLVEHVHVTRAQTNDALPKPHQTL